VTLTDIDWRRAADRYAETLAQAGAITDPAWRAVFAAVPRHVFVPQFWQLDEYNVPATLVDGSDPDRRGTWLDAVYSDQLLITQWTPETRPDGTETRIITSSASQPWIVAVMLDRLNLQPGARVLEIGTGTGYNTALLCARVGETGHVVSVDIHPDLVNTAGQRLTAAGYTPRLQVGDGAAGVPDAAPFDALIATCAVSHIPPAWIEQLAPGGRLVAPLTLGGALLVADKHSTDEIRGRIDATAAYFMPLRSTADQPMPAGHAPGIPTPDRIPYSGVTDVNPHAVNDPDFALWLSLHLPDVHIAWTCDDDGTTTGAIVYTATDRAVADYQPTTDGLWPVTQYGHRPWDTVETAWRAFERADRPGRDRLGITASTDGTARVWLDDPDSTVEWPLPS
jgi:protein-L-isoaspartate(D-aspartate) O-methyltransferase